jgi:hypothetical protein
MMPPAMPPLPLDPPGGLAWHVPVVVASPAIAALGAGWAGAIAPPGRWQTGIRAIGLAAALALAALALLPGGAAAAFADTQILAGWLRLTPWTATAAVLAGVIAATTAPAGRGPRTAAALLLPISCVPLLALADEPAAGAPRRRWRVGVAAAGTVAAVWLPGWAVMVLAMPLLMWLLPQTRRPWMVVLGLGALAALP